MRWSARTGASCPHGRRDGDFHALTDPEVETVEQIVAEAFHLDGDDFKVDEVPSAFPQD